MSLCRKLSVSHSLRNVWWTANQLQGLILFDVINIWKVGLIFKKGNYINKLFKHIGCKKVKIPFFMSNFPWFGGIAVNQSN